MLAPLPTSVCKGSTVESASFDAAPCGEGKALQLPLPCCGSMPSVAWVWHNLCQVDSLPFKSSAAPFTAFVGTSQILVAHALGGLTP
ncbi:hypothetical protein FKM82_013821 [Ascaphus truei]